MHVQRFLKQLLLEGADLGVVFGYCRDGTMVFNETTLAIRQNRQFAHVTILVSRLCQGFHPLAPFQPFEFFVVNALELLLPAFQERIDFFSTIHRRDLVEEAEGELAIRRWELLVRSIGEAEYLERAANLLTLHPALDQPFTLKSGQMLPHPHGSDANVRAKLLDRHLSVVLYKVQDFLASWLVVS